MGTVLALLAIATVAAIALLPLATIWLYVAPMIERHRGVEDSRAP